MVPTFVLLYILCIVGFICFGIFMIWYNSPKQKGKRGEKQVYNKLMKLSDDYTIINDVVLYTKSGTTQVDHVVVSPYGIFVIETKNLCGDIYGNDERQEWTQMIVNRYVTKNRFYNPVKQSLGHVRHIKNMLKEFPFIPIVPVVVFTDRANLRIEKSQYDVMYTDELLDFINSRKDVYLNESDVKRILDIFYQKNVRNFVDDKKHTENVEYIRERENERAENAISYGSCPKCGGMLVERHGKYGRFYGCSNYPNCKYTLNLE